MPRKLQHITFQGRADDAAREGTKVETLCGVRVYPMPNMKDEIPTCSPCARALMKAHKEEVLKKTTTYYVTYSNGNAATWTTGGAA